MDGWFWRHGTAGWLAGWLVGGEASPTATLRICTLLYQDSRSYSGISEWPLSEWHFDKGIC